MFDGVMILVLVMEYNAFIQGELQGPSGTKKEVAVIHSVYHWILTISDINLDHKITLSYMEQSTKELMG